MKSLFFIFFSVLFFSKANAQSLAINTDGSIANASSILDVKSTAKGMLIPRMNKTERNAIGSPATGLLVFVNAPDTVGFSYYNGSNWVWIASGNYATDTTAWKLTGNSNTTSQTFVGTTNDTALHFRIRNIASGIIDSTTQNTALGYEALKRNNLAGSTNTAFGFGTGKLLTIGTGNVIMGRNALSATGTSSQNIAIGDSAMGNAIWSFGNTAVGYQTLKNLDGRFSYTYNTAIGYASQNAATGNTDPTVSSLNTSVGGYSMADNVTGKNNVAIGVSALRFNDSSSRNTAVGQNALAYHKRNGDSYNVAVGTSALERDIVGVWNTVAGGEAMQYATRSTLNSAIGFRTLRLIMDGGENNTLGVGSMEYKDTALSCVAIGRFALSGSSVFNNSPDTGSIAIGTRAGRFNNANYNTFIGYESGIGNSSNSLGITGAETVSIGAFSLNKLQSGASNSTFGYAALFNNISGSKNIAVGSRSLYNNIISNYNVGIGDSALYFNGSLAFTATQALGNIGIGSKSMWTNIYGSNNIALGREALAGNNDGDNNIGIGYRVGNGITNGSNNIFIGNNSGGVLNVSNKLFIENSNADKDNALIYGDFAADSISLNAKTVVRDNAVIRGYTKLGGYGTDVPNIKMITITGTTPAVDNFLAYPTGIADAKVLSFSVLVEYAGGWKMPPSYRDAAGYEYNVQFQAGNVVIVNKLGNSANIGAKPFRVLITYEQ
jgi:carbonic anhydrase/acetyltransferase-like protein (isoleucine patch superfamily)